ncbi:sigma-E factor regulatory protein RseB domain-containing protein [Alteribacter natronophilus]|uniref:sigma-E factor regulatory protein RseB domain-containing protein n=1 Tax=Alteribacter natronophilus TaxID=2583810 RepID=UPI001487559B|nr:sigma-E factor regulatory protein RseB domain-containing protein [Alteribacter natronophilus]
MKRAVCACGTVLLFTAACAVEDTDKLVENAIAAQENLEGYYAEVESSFAFGDENDTSTYKEWVKGERYRYEQEDYITVSDGETTWSYDVESNVVMIMDDTVWEDEEMPDQSEMMREMLTDMMESNDVVAHGRETVADRETIHLSLTPSDEEEIAMFGDGSYEIWIDEETYLPLRMEWDGEDFTTSMIYTMIDYDINLDDSFFTFEIPEGAEVGTWDDWETEMGSMTMSLEELRESTEMTVPETAYLPDGYEFEDAFHYEFSGDESAILNFSNGGHESFSLGISNSVEQYGFEGAEVDSVMIGDIEGERISMYDMTILSWTDSGLQYELMSFGEDLEYDELLKVAEGLEY